MTDEQKNATIISFADRSKKEVPQEPAKPTPEEIKKQADEATVKAIEGFLEQAKLGVLKGFVALSWNTEDQCFHRAIYLPAGSEFMIMSNVYMGGMHHLLADLTDFVGDMTETEMVEEDGGDEL